MVYQKECKSCGTIFTTKLSWQLYCTSKCKNKFKRKNNKIFKTEIHKCKYCNKDFEWSEKRKTQIYCSVDCRNKAGRIKAKNKDYIHNCINCNKVITGKTNREKIFCSVECENEYRMNEQKKLLELELDESLNNENWVETKNILRDIVFIKVKEIINLSETYVPHTGFNNQSIDYWSIGDIPSPTRQFVLERDNNECQICKNKSNLHIHHIVKRTNGGNHDPSNLVTLCSSCHRHIEVGDINSATEKCYKNALRYYGLNDDNDAISFKSIYDSLITIFNNITYEKDYIAASNNVNYLIDKIEQSIF